MIKAIETHYNGYKFRSRLEARWAVFFDNLDIRYDYEPEGFELGDGGYLPDFFLPDCFDGCWIEIKPRRENINVGDWVGDIHHEGELKMFHLADGLDSNGIVFYGDPYPGSYFAMTFAGSDKVPSDYAEELYQCLDCGLISVGTKDCKRPFYNPFSSMKKTCLWCEDSSSDKIHGHFMRASVAARSARFSRR